MNEPFDIVVEIVQGKEYAIPSIVEVQDSTDYVAFISHNGNSVTFNKQHLIAYAITYKDEE